MVPVLRSLRSFLTKPNLTKSQLMNIYVTAPVERNSMVLKLRSLRSFLTKPNLTKSQLMIIYGTAPEIIYYNSSWLHLTKEVD
jgi:hypothetical protein